MREAGLKDPWKEITQSSSSDSVVSRRVDDHPHNFFWSRDHLGRCGFLFRGHETLKISTRMPELAGIDIEYSERPDNQCELHLFLDSSTSKDIFRTACNDLLDATKHIDSAKPKAVVQTVLTRLSRWQELMRIPSRNTLSETTIIGLYGEILALKDLFLSRLDPVTAISAWQGPLGAEQDFVFRNHLIEIKTQLASADKKLRISSLEQLDCLSGNIFLLHQTISPAQPDEQDAMSLQTLVDNVRGSIAGNIYAADLFERSLLESGFSNNDAYNAVCYARVSRKPYRISDDFPCLTRASVPAAISAASYILEVASCTPWEIDMATMIEEVFK